VVFQATGFMQGKRLLLFVPAAIAILAVAALVAAWLIARTSYARELVADEIAAVTGLPTTVGSLGLAFFPLPALDVGGISVAQPAGFGPKPFLEIGRVRASIPWRSLFGSAAIGQLSITELVARPIVNADGMANWSLLFAEPAAGGEPAPAPDWSLGGLAIEQGAIEYRDDATGTGWQLGPIKLAAEDVAPGKAFPLELELGGVFGANTILYAMKGQGLLDPAAGRYEASAVEFRGWAGGEPMPLAGVELTGAMKRASFAATTGVATLESGRFNLAGIPGEFGGSVNFEAPELEADFLVRTEPFAPRPPSVAFGFPLPATTDPDAFDSLQLSLQGELRGGEILLDPVSGQLDETNFDARIVPGERQIRASLDRIDVNRYLAPPPKAQKRSRRETKQTLEATIAELAKFDIDAEIRIAVAEVAGATLRDSVIRVERGDDASP
jgi:AsmA protein